MSLEVELNYNFMMILHKDGLLLTIVVDYFYAFLHYILFKNANNNNSRE